MSIEKLSIMTVGGGGVLRAYAALIALGLIWGSNFIYMKWATALISPGQVVLLRVLFGFLPLAIVAWRARIITRAQLRYLPHFAVMSVLATSFYYYGFVEGTARLSSSVAGLLSGSIPIFTFLCAFLFLRNERPTRVMALGVALGFIGIVLSAQPWADSDTAPLSGVLWMMAGTLSLGVSFVYARRFLSPLNLSPLALATWQTGLALLTLLIITDSHGIFAITADGYTLLGLVLGLGILGTGLAYLIYYFIVQKLGAVGASGATYIAPVIAVAIGAAVGEDISLFDLLALTFDPRRCCPDPDRSTDTCASAAHEKRSTEAKHSATSRTGIAGGFNHQCGKAKWRVSPPVLLKEIHTGSYVAVSLSSSSGA